MEKLSGCIRFDIVLEEIKGIDFVLNCDKERKPGIMSISFPGRDSEQLLHRLDLKGIMISTGAACNSVNIVVALVDNEVTLKRYRPDLANSRIILHPENKRMKDIVVDECKIQGVAIKVIKDLEN